VNSQKILKIRLALSRSAQAIILQKFFFVPEMENFTGRRICAKKKAPTTAAALPTQDRYPDKTQE
jgi:hypothetical protein